jgi:hypothetical protein
MVPEVPGSDTDVTDAPRSSRCAPSSRTVTAGLPVLFAFTTAVPHAKSRWNTLEATE